MSKQRVSRHIWLQDTPHGIRAGNVLSGRSTLLNASELEELELFSAGRSVDPENPAHRYFLEADLLVAGNSQAQPTPRLESVDKTLVKYLSDRLEIGPRRVRERFPDRLARLDQVLDLALDSIQSKPALTEAEKSSIEHELRALVDHARLFLLLETEPSEEFQFASGFLSAIPGRPLPREDYEQQPCMPETSQRRMELALTFLRPDNKGLILGDDDLLSVYWSQNFEQECAVFELDEELLNFLKPRLSDKVSLQARDLTTGLPEEFRGQFDIVLTDPMYERCGMDLFLKCCRQGLSEHPEATVLFTTRPDMIQDGHLLEERMGEAGLRVESHIQNFSRYRLPDFYRRKLVRGFHACGLSPQLVQGLSQIPYLYADMFVLRGT